MWWKYEILVVSDHNIGKSPMQLESRCSYAAVHYQYTRDKYEDKTLAYFSLALTTGLVPTCDKILVAPFRLKNLSFDLYSKLSRSLFFPVSSSDETN